MLRRDEMKTVLVRWPLAFVITATSSISAVVQLDGQSICGKGAGFSHAAVPDDTTLTGGGHTNHWFTAAETLRSKMSK